MIGQFKLRITYESPAIHLEAGAADRIASRHIHVVRYSPKNDPRLLHAPRLKTPLQGGAVISWCGEGMTEERMDALIAALRAPALRVPLEPLGR